MQPAVLCIVRGGHSLYGSHLLWIGLYLLLQLLLLTVRGFESYICDFFSSFLFRPSEPIRFDFEIDDVLSIFMVFRVTHLWQPVYSSSSISFICAIKPMIMTASCSFKISGDLLYIFYIEIIYV